MASKASTKKKKTAKVEVKKCNCLICGEEFDLTKSNFFSVKNTKRWNTFDGFAPFCKNCLEKRLEKLSREYDERSAVIMMCNLLDLPFMNTVYVNYEINSKKFAIGEYIRTCGLGQYVDKDFITSFFMGELSLNVQNSEDVRWSNKDKRYKSRVLNIIGYDPFLEYSDDIRKNLFATTDDYLNDESIVEDTHRLKTLVDMMVNQGQILTIDNNINRVLKEKVNLEQSNIKDLVDMKKSLMNINAKLAKENGIATSSTNKNTSGSSSLSYHVKQLNDIDFTAVEHNLFDIKTSEALKFISDISNKSIMNTLALGENEMLTMVQEQRKKVIDLENKVSDLEEKLRLANLELAGQKLKRVNI